MLWDKSLSVGIETIDNQHQRIIAYINELEYALRDHDRAAVGAIIEHMINYTITHFSFEEAIMEQVGYRLCREHRLVHESFTRQMQEFRRRFTGGEDVARQLLTVLRTWLVNHIKRDDQDYAEPARAALQPNWVKQTLLRFFA